MGHPAIVGEVPVGGVPVGVVDVEVEVEGWVVVDGVVEVDVDVEPLGLVFALFEPPPPHAVHTKPTAIAEPRKRK
jgi:hypothetical protein